MKYAPSPTLLRRLLPMTVFMGILIATSYAFAGGGTVLKFDFSTDGSTPWANLITDGTNYYGTVAYTNPHYFGLVFELSPPASGNGAWTETTLYAFTGQGDGDQPEAGLIRDAKGNLYGTTAYGGFTNLGYCFNGCGVVFELSPPSEPGGSWTETTLYQFRGAEDGSEPQSSVIFDPEGNLYGTTVDGGQVGACCGTAYELSPPQSSGGTWKETVLHLFKGGNDGSEVEAPLYRDSEGRLYGTTVFGGAASGNGIIFRLVPPVAGNYWMEQILYSFKATTDGAVPTAGLMEYQGSFYGTAPLGGNLRGSCPGAAGGTGCGVVYRITPEVGGSEWEYTVLYAFSGSDGMLPGAGVIFDGEGNLYGTTPFGGDINSKSCRDPYYPGCGVVFKLSPQSGGETWTESVLQTFEGANGYESQASLLLSNGLLWGTTMQGGGDVTECDQGCGTVFAVSP